MNFNKCEWIKDNIDAFLDSEMSPEENQMLNDHIEECETCREELELAKEMMGILRSLPEKECPERVIENIEREIKEKKSDKKIQPVLIRGPKIIKWGLAAAAILLIGFAISKVKQSPEIPNRNIPASPSQREVEIAEMQLKITLAYMGQVAGKSTILACEEAVESSIKPPIRKAVFDILEKTEFLKLQKNKNERKENS